MWLLSGFDFLNFRCSRLVHTEVVTAVVEGWNPVFPDLTLCGTRGVGLAIIFIKLDARIENSFMSYDVSACGLGTRVTQSGDHSRLF